MTIDKTVRIPPTKTVRRIPPTKTVRRVPPTKTVVRRAPLLTGMGMNCKRSSGLCLWYLPHSTYQTPELCSCRWLFIVFFPTFFSILSQCSPLIYFGKSNQVGQNPGLCCRCVACPPFFFFSPFPRDWYV